MSALDRMLLALLGDWTTKAGILSHERWIARWRDLDGALDKLSRRGLVERHDTAIGPMWRRSEAALLPAGNGQRHRTPTPRREAA